MITLLLESLLGLVDEGGSEVLCEEMVDVKILLGTEDEIEDWHPAKINVRNIGDINNIFWKLRMRVYNKIFSFRLTMR